MTNLVPNVACTVAISISESSNLDVFGLSKVHLRDAMEEIALNLLSAGEAWRTAGIYVLMDLPIFYSN